MRPVNSKISEEQLAGLKASYPIKGKNSDIGKMAVEMVRLYFLSQHSAIIFKPCTTGGDIITCVNDLENHYEIKGTESSDIAFSKLKVSSWHCHNALVAGMELVRVTNIGNTQVQIHFMKYGEDFQLESEPRWSVKRLNP